MSKPEPLEFARGIRFPRPDEIPGAEADALQRLASANITTGYVMKAVEAQPFLVIIEANVHASRLWDTFRELVSSLLPEVAAPILGVKEEEPILGPYTSKEAALSLLERYREPLVHDGFLEFGLIFSYAGKTDEVFVKNVKYLQVWTNHPNEATAILERTGVPAVSDLQFIDEFPRVSEALPFGGQSSGWHAVLEGVQAGFGELPVRVPPGGA
jgi:hypothetical protein